MHSPCLSTVALVLLGAAAGAAAQPPVRDAFDGYRATNDQPVLDWRQSNAQVARIGGWRAYAREAAAAAAAASAAAAPATSSPADTLHHGRPAK